jgi:glucose-1-phosphate cytidylyltransferase
VKVVLFCGGLGTRLREHSETIPKPLVNIGYRPIVWHLMRYYAHFGHTDFVLCLGYRGDLIKDFFLTYNECLSNDFTMSEGGKKIQLERSDIDSWRITFVDTGLNSNIGQRLKAVQRHLDGEALFLANYSDGLSDLPLNDYIDDFKRNDAIASFVSVRPSQTFHGVHLDAKGYVSDIQHVRDTDYWINGGYFVFRREIFDYMKDGEELVEQPFQRLIAARRLMSHRYSGFWAAMDTFKEKINFDNMYARGDTPWTVWKK